MAKPTTMRSPILPSRRSFLVASSALVATGCFGSFGATNALYEWNKGVSDNKWIRWLVFLVCIIVPVYQVFVFADAIVLNTIEFFTGNNPVSGAHVKLANGQTLATSATDDPNVVKHELFEDGKPVRTLYVRRLGEREMQLLDERRTPVGTARVLDDGSVELLDADGHVTSTIPPASVEQVSAAIERGATPTYAVMSSLESMAPDNQLADATR